MMTIRCTRKLLDRMGGGAWPEVSTPPTTALGDWHATILFVRPAQLVLCVNDRSRLPALVPAKGIVDFPARLRERLETLLHRIGVLGAAATRELGEMADVGFPKTRDRSVLGSLNDFQFASEYSYGVRPFRDIDEWNWHLSGTPCGPLKYAYPRDVVLEVLGTTQHRAAPDGRR